MAGKILLIHGKPLSASLPRRHADIQEVLRNSPLLHADGTGLDINASLYWAHVACTQDTVHYHGCRRSAGMLEGGILGNPVPTSVHDFWKPCWKEQLKIGKHGLCMAQLVRELETVLALDEGASWAWELINMLLMLLRANKTCKQAREKKRKTLRRYKLRAFDKQYRRLVEEEKNAIHEIPGNPGEEELPSHTQSISWSIWKNISQASSFSCTLSRSPLQTTARNKP